MLNHFIFFGILFTLSGCSDTQFNEGPTEVEQDATILENARIFNTSESRIGSVSYTSSSDELEYGFSLHKAPDRQLQTKQLSRESVSFSRTQGQPGSKHSETIKLKTDGPLDLLIVIDNSNTMENYQDRLTHIEPLLGDIYNADWRIGVVTTDSPCLRPNQKPITRNEYLRNPYGTLSRFADAIRAGTQGNPVERGIEMAIRGFLGDCDGQTLNWTRTNAKKAVFLVSDEENCGSAVNEVGCQNNDPSAPETYVYHGPDDYITRLGETTKFYALLHDDDICGEDFYDVDPEDYLELVSRTGGMWGPICADDYSPLLQEISKDVGQIRLEKVELEYPVDTHLPFEIKVDGKILDANMFNIVGHTVKIQPDILENADTMEITYTHGSADVFDKLDFKHPVDPSSLVVFQDGTQLDPSSYDILSQGKVVKFKHRLPPGTKIEGSYKADGILKNDFLIPEGVIAHSLTINQEPISETDYAIKGDRLLLKHVPPDDALIDLVYNFTKEITSSYTIPTIPVNGYMEASELIDAKSGKSMSHRIQGQTLTLDPKEVQDNRQVNLTYRFYPNEDRFTIALPHTPNESSIAVSAENCEIKDINLKIPSITLYCSNGVPEMLDINYSYQTPVQHIFELEEKAHMQRWRVWVDGQITNKYHLEGSFIHIDPTILGPLSVIWVVKS
jgi:hypothetical protein